MVIRIQLFSIQFSHEHLKMLNQNFTIYNINIIYSNYYFYHFPPLRYSLAKKTEY